MARMHASRAGAAALMAAVAYTGIARPAWARQNAAPAVAVWIQDEALVPSDVLALAQSEVIRVYHHAGVKIVWATATTADLILVIGGDTITKHMNVGAGSMGQSIVSAEARRGRRAYVFYGPIEERAAEWRVGIAEILGAVMAHEIGHLLGCAHATGGIMRAGWNPTDFVVGPPGLLLFAPAEADLIRGRVARR